MATAPYTSADYADVQGYRGDESLEATDWWSGGQQRGLSLNSGGARYDRNEAFWSDTNQKGLAAFFTPNLQTALNPFQMFNLAWGGGSTPKHTNIRQYADDSIVYDYGGSATNKVMVTSRDWSGSGVPLAASGGAEGWAVSKPLPAGEEFTPEELFKDYGLYWKGWSTEQVGAAARQAFGEMTSMTMKQSRSLSDKLYAQADMRAEKNITDFPAVSQRALDATRIAGDALSRDMSAQFNANLDTYMPGWREKIVGASGDLTEGTANIGKVLKERIMPELSYNLLQTRAMLQNASRPMLAGEVPMSVTMAALGNQRGSSAAGRGLTARDLGLTSRDMQGLGYAGITAASALQPAVDKGVLGILGAQGEAARAHGATVGQFTAPMVDTGSLYGGIMQGLSAGAAMNPNQIFGLGMQSYESQLNAGMNLFGQMQQLAVDQAATFNESVQPAG